MSSRSIWFAIDGVLRDESIIYSKNTYLKSLANTLLVLLFWSAINLIRKTSEYLMASIININDD